MGADEKSILKKCGEILINIKNKSKKTKIYKFNCTYCNVHYDQLKKFSIHVEEKHLTQILDDSEEVSLVCVPEIKEEDINEIVDKTEQQQNVCSSNYEDPLETNQTNEPTKDEENMEILKVEIKEEEQPQQFHTMDCDGYDSNNEESDYEDCFADDNDVDYSNNESSDSECNDKEYSKRGRKRRKLLSDSDANENESKSKNSSTKQTKKCLKRSEVISTDVDDKEVCIALLKALEKQTSLWVVKKRSNINRTNKCYFEIIANEVNEKLSTNLTWEEAKLRIRDMRYQYAVEMQKKNNGEECEFPWYAEHMKFLRDDLNNLTKKARKKYPPLKTMDDSELSILIDVYKSYDSLWQVNNIAHGARRKKYEVFRKIIEDLKSKHNQDINFEELNRRVIYMLRIYSENKKLHLKSELEKCNFKPTTELYEKMTFLSDSQGPFMCSHCNEIIDRYDNYHLHVSKHTGAIPFPCPLCEKSFDKYNNYIIHARRHMELNNHFCKYCDRGFPTTTELAKHERSHTGETPYLCQMCGATFKTPDAYHDHIRRHENRFRFNCHICNHGFNKSSELKDHVKAHLNIRDIVCNICGKSFTAKKHLRYHKLIHSADKNYKCKICGKAFAQSAGLRQHRKKQHESFAAQYKKDLNLDI